MNDCKIYRAGSIHIFQAVHKNRSFASSKTVSNVWPSSLSEDLFMLAQVLVVALVEAWLPHGGQEVFLCFRLKCEEKDERTQKYFEQLV